MSDLVIKAETLGKKYTIGHQTNGERYSTLRETLARNVGNLWKKTGDFIQGRPIIPGNEIEEVWALSEVSFQVRRGETLGIIGRNGAGKSTLLKILSRITEPSAGRVTIRGRVSSLLEVGVGFHPELTGRENIYLNGAILGMTRAEIRARFDAIVEFAEIHRFLDTPVKRYSSGMYVRLAFAVAAHLEPEILMVDEVLAVGDFAFQQKCLGKMGEVAKEGRTVLFVSHNLAAVENFCFRSVLLESGQVVADGPSSETIKSYLGRTGREKMSLDLSNRTDRQGSGECRCRRVWLETRDGVSVDHFCSGDRSLYINFLVTPGSPDAVIRGVATLLIKDAMGYQLMALRSEEKEGLLTVDGPTVISFSMERMHLMPGAYFCNVYFGRWGGNEPYDFLENAVMLRIEPGDFFETGKILGPQPEKFVVNYDVISRKAETHEPLQSDT